MNNALEKSNKKKISGGMKFFIGVLFAYAIVTLLNFQLAQESISDFLQMFLKIIPILFLVFFIMVATDLYFTKEKVGKYLGEESGIRGWLYAIIAGILVSGPPYILFPLLQGFKEKGVKDSLLAVFLYNRNVKLQFMPVMIYYFGLKFTILVSIYIIIFSVFNGMIVGRLAKQTGDSVKRI
ncbi:hypothetical protein D4R87_01340 [bacterium]|nr:MAG: hypothetical protein D4R87_01340 [bacterium]